MRVGVIGVGAMGQHHVRVYSEMNDVELVGVSDISESRVREISCKFGIKGFKDYKELLKQDLDAVNIVVPTTLHTEIGIDAINFGVNILVEKPIADTIENARKLVDAAERAGVKLMIGHIERFNPAVIRLKREIDSGNLGRAVSIYARRVGPYNPRIRDVGVILDIGVHDIDVISYLYGKKVKEVYAIAGSSIHSKEDHATVIIRFGEDCSGMVETNWLTPHKIRNLTAIGVSGVAYLDYLNQSLDIHDREWIKKAKIEKREPLRVELEYFINAIKNKTKVSPDGEEGLDTLKVALASIESYMEKKSIYISE